MTLFRGAFNMTTQDELLKLKHDAGLKIMPTELTYKYRMAMSGQYGISDEIDWLIYQWEDKPHRLIFDLCGELEKIAAEKK